MFGYGGGVLETDKTGCMIKTSRFTKHSWYRAHQRRLSAVGGVIAVLLISFLFFLVQSHRLPGQVGARVWFFDVGQGDATFLETASGSQMLIDGGVNNTVLTKLGSVMWPWDYAIDALVMTHPDADHVNGLVEVLDRYNVGVVYVNEVDPEEEIENAFFTRAIASGVEVVVLRAGDRFVFDEWEMSVLWPTEEAMLDPSMSQNDQSIVLRLETEGACLLLMGDAERDVEEGLVETILPCEILKAGHHGSSSSSSVSFLEAVSPEVAVISAGENNRYGHPHEIVLERFSDAGVSVLRTDLHEDIFFFLSENGKIIQTNPLSF